MSRAIQPVAHAATHGYAAFSLTRARFSMTTLMVLHRKWMKEPGYRETYDALAGTFALIEARARSGLSQIELAERIKTTQGSIARLENGNTRPSMRVLERFAEATGHRLRIGFEPTANSAHRRQRASSDL